MTEERPRTDRVDDDEIAQSIRFMQQDRSRKRIYSVLGVIAVLGILMMAIYLAYSDTPDSLKEIEATQPGVP